MAQKGEHQLPRDSKAQAGEAVVRKQRGRPRKPPEEQRRRLLDSAERCFEREPYNDVSILDIVQEAGMSTRSFYGFFEGKADLAVQLLEDRGESFMAEIERLTDGAESALDVVDRVLRVHIERFPLIMVELDRVTGPAGERVKWVRDQARKRISEIILREIGKASLRGLITKVPDPMAVIIVLEGIESISKRYTAERRRDELTAMHPQILSALRKLFPETLGEDPPP